MKNTSFLVAILAYTLLLSACTKEKKPEDFLTGASCWKKVKIEIRASASADWKEKSVDDCALDDCFSFTSKEKINIDKGTNKCKSTEHQTTIGTYSLSEDGEYLSIQHDDFVFPLNLISVEELTATKMVLTTSFFTDTRTTYEAQ